MKYVFFFMVVAVSLGCRSNSSKSDSNDDGKNPNTRIVGLDFGSVVGIPEDIPESHIQLSEGDANLAVRTLRFLTMPNTVKAVNKTLNVKFAPASAKVAMGKVSIAIENKPLPLALMGRDDYQLAVFYQVEDGAGGSIFGYLSLRKLVLETNKVIFPYQGNGNYQLGYLYDPGPKQVDLVVQNAEEADLNPKDDLVVAKICTEEGQTGCVLDSNKHVAIEKSKLVAENFKEGINIAGVLGNIKAYSNCTIDGQEGCVTEGPFKAADTSTITEWDIRIDKTVGGIKGMLAFYKNAIQSGLDPNTQSPAVEGRDVWDTVEDYNPVEENYITPVVPQSDSGRWNVASGSNWTGIASNAFKDEFTGLIWGPTGSDKKWQEAIEYCSNSSASNRDDWRLPTQKELLQAYINGIAYKVSELSLVVGQYWSATSYGPLPSAGGFAYNVGLLQGIASFQPGAKGVLRHVICVAE